MSRARRILALLSVTAAVAAAAGPGLTATRAGCSATGGLPDAACTPGAALRGVRAADVCRPGYAASVRHVSASRKRAVFAAYGIPGRRHGNRFEVDHLISLELGGSNAIENLWPEAASPRPGFREKDRLENLLHRRVCAGKLTLRRAQRIISRNWLATFRSAEA
jgi:hypothetical protein